MVVKEYNTISTIINQLSVQKAQIEKEIKEAIQRQDQLCIEFIHNNCALCKHFDHFDRDTSYGKVPACQNIQYFEKYPGKLYCLSGYDGHYTPLTFIDIKHTIFPILMSESTKDPEPEILCPFYVRDSKIKCVL